MSDKEFYEMLDTLDEIKLPEFDHHVVSFEEYEEYLNKKDKDENNKINSSK